MTCEQYFDGRRQRCRQNWTKQSSKIGNDVAVDLKQDIRDLIFQRRITKGQIFFPTTLDGGSLFKKEEQINRHQDQAQEKAGDAEKSANAFLNDCPDLLREVGQLFFKIG